MLKLPLQITLLAFVLLQVACRNENQPDTGQDAVLTSGLYPEHMDTTVTPGDNFQYFINGAWIKNTEIPADKSSYGIGAIINEKVQEEVKKIIEKSASANTGPGTDEQKIGDLYASYMDSVKRNEIGITPLKPELDKIDAISDPESLVRYFAYAIKSGFTAPVDYFIMPDLKKPTEYALYYWQGGLGLPDREYYLSNDGEFPRIRKEYVNHIAKMLELAGLTQTDKSAAAIMALETKLAAQHMKKEDTRDIERLYNRFSVDTLAGLTPDFDWTVFLAEAGVPEIKSLIITQPGFVKALDGLIKSTDLATWKTYLKWGLANNTAGQLNDALDEQNFRFYGTTLNGTEKQLPRWRRAVNLVNDNLGELVGKVYVKEHFPPAAKARMLELVGNLTKAYEASIKELDWMSEETKKQALDKLGKFNPKIGYPDKWKDYSSVDIKKEDLFGSLQSCAVAAYQKEIDKIGSPIDKTEWGMNPQTIDAYYNPTMNEIVFPAGILQPPFFDMNADDAVNYGAIGGVIGHEIGHGFDDQGSTFDGDGVLRDWWTPADKENFKKRTGSLVEQYNQFKVFDDLNVNGEFTLGENIGDLGGLSIALKAYQMSLNGKEAPVMDGFTGVQRVFMGWAQAWRRKSRPEALRMQVSTDPHSPADFRVNGVVRNIPEFYTAFNVQPGDSLYLAPEKRIKIW